MEKKDNIFLNGIRWVIALPLALLSYFIGYRIFMWGNNEFAGLSFLHNIMEVIGCGFAAAAFVIVGTYICPKYRKTVAIVFATIGSILGVFGCFTELLSSDLSVLVLLSHIANIVGSIAGAFLVYEYIEEEAGSYQ